MESWYTYFRRAFSREMAEDRFAGGESPTSLWDNLKLLFPAIKKHWKLWVVAAILLLAGSFLSYPQPFIMRYLIDDVVGKKQAHLLVWVLGLWVAVAFGAKVTGILRQFYVTRFDQEITISIQQDLLEKTMRLPKAFFDVTQTGYLMSRLTNDVQGVRWFFSGTVVQLVDQGLRLVGGTVCLFWLEWRIAVPVVCTLPICWFVARYFSRRAYVMGHHQREQHARVTTRFQESLASISHIKAFASENRAIGQLVAELRRSMALALEQLALNTVNSNAMNLMPSLARFFVVGFGMYWILQDQWTLGDLWAFQRFVGYVYGPALFLANTNMQLQNSRASLERVAALYRIVPEDNVGIGERVQRLSGKLEFDDVSFSYSREAVLENVSFAVQPGEHVAIVGHSGAGKTTLISLILRFYNPTAGEIRFDGRPVSHYEVRSLRERIGYVSQNTRLLSGSLLDNLRYGNPGVSDEQVVRAAQAAEIHEFVMGLPDGYETETGENGVSLSEGQRQRLSIARALVKDPDILILDEPTSALDAGTELSILQTLPEVARGKTVFIIAHSLSTVRRAQRIMVLDDSRLVAVGTHNALMDTCDTYRELFGEPNLEST